ncbi:hypothetical protein AVDCRST_MAG92-3993 [uncultured Coleofasciculus sp.]|uniref:Uncharacterized protein n=1 Tax=uncultured Coleofasciculus sp. TaxID=1267456 RepID=A0A6J4JT83_9CYAN|nr:hypothetical protein AVDCRST_MAG92-3993 [uncultured Coleofasciculus sp.]
MRFGLLELGDRHALLRSLERSIELTIGIVALFYATVTKR